MGDTFPASLGRAPPTLAYNRHPAVKKFRYHIFSLVALLFCVASIFGWWRSTRIWEGHYLESPYGIASLQSESSILVVGVEFMQHDHRWYAWSNGDEIWNDSMKFVWEAPRFQTGYGKYSMLLPYWQLTGLLLLLSGGLFFYEWKRRRKLTEPPPSLSPAPATD